MKNLTLPISAMFLILSAVFLTFGAGCTTASSGGYTLKQTRNDVNWAMVRYHNREAAGFITSAERQQVMAAYKAYQAAFDAASQQVQSNLDTPAPANVKQSADQLLSILGAIP
jgi:multidrug resistance efflux pump